MKHPITTWCAILLTIFFFLVRISNSSNTNEILISKSCFSSSGCVEIVQTERINEHVVRTSYRIPVFENMPSFVVDCVRFQDKRATPIEILLFYKHVLKQSMQITIPKIFAADISGLLDHFPGFKWTTSDEDGRYEKELSLRFFPPDGLYVHHVRGRLSHETHEKQQQHEEEKEKSQPTTTMQKSKKDEFHVVLIHNTETTKIFALLSSIHKFLDPQSGTCGERPIGVSKETPLGPRCGPIEPPYGGSIDPSHDGQKIIIHIIVRPLHVFLFNHSLSKANFTRFTVKLKLVSDDDVAQKTFGFGFMMKKNKELLLLPDLFLNVDEILFLDNNTVIQNDIIFVMKQMRSSSPRGLVVAYPEQSDYYQNLITPNILSFGRPLEPSQPHCFSGISTNIMLLHLEKLRRVEFESVWLQTVLTYLKLMRHMSWLPLSGIGTLFDRSDQTIFNIVLREHPQWGGILPLV